MKGTTTIIRAQHRHRFLIIDLRAVEDARLFWAARGLLSYLISRPDKLESSRSKDLQHRGDLKRDGIYKLLREFHWKVLGPRICNTAATSKETASTNCSVSSTEWGISRARR